MKFKSRQMAFFRAKAGQKAAFRVMLKYFELENSPKKARALIG